MYTGMWREDVINTMLTLLKHFLYLEKTTSYMLPTEQSETSIRLKQHPYQNEQMADMEGEVWKTIPYSNEAYIMSNYGRVKSLARIVYRKNGTTISIPERIKKPRIRRIHNVSKYNPGRIAYTIDIGINVDGHKYIIVASRYLYYLFIEEFDLSDFNKKITFKDNNHLNLSLDNLELSTVSDVMKKSFVNGKIRIRHGCRAKKIAQYNLNGEFIAEYPSITVAARAIGTHSASIYRAVIGELRQTKGFIFKEI
jgi:hypothetical protein